MTLLMHWWMVKHSELLQKILAVVTEIPAWQGLISTRILGFALSCVKFCLGFHTCGEGASGM